MQASAPASCPQPHRPRLMLLPLRSSGTDPLGHRRRHFARVPSAWVAATASVPHFVAAVPMVTKADPRRIQKRVSSSGFIQANATCLPRCSAISNIQIPLTTCWMTQQSHTVAGWARAILRRVCAHQLLQGWIETTMRNCCDGGVCSASRILDSDLRCPPGAGGDAEGHDPLLGLLGNGGAPSSLASATAMAETEAARALEAGDGLISSHLDTPYRSHSGHLCSVSSMPPGHTVQDPGSNFRLLGCAGRLCPAGSVSLGKSRADAFHCPGDRRPRKPLPDTSACELDSFNPNLER